VLQVSPSHFQSAIAKTSIYSVNSLLSTYSFANIAAHYGIPNIPSCFSHLFSSAPSSSSSSISFTVSKKSPVELPVNSIVGGLCYHLLAILRNLFGISVVLDELLEFAQLNELLELLCLNSQSSDFGLVVHKQLVRSLCVFTNTGTVAFSWKFTNI
jgi:hypothetical protein